MIRKAVVFGMMLIVCLTGSTARCESTEVPEFVEVWNFDDGVFNRFNAIFNQFQGAPSTAGTRLVDHEYVGQGGRSWEIRADRKESGFCGAWMQLFSHDQNDEMTREYFDASKYGYLTFQVKGAKGGEVFNVKLADAALVQLEDSALLIDIGDALGTNVTTQWQQVMIPLENAELDLGINLSQLGGLTFEFVQPGEQRIYIDDIYFVKSRDTELPVSEAVEVIVREKPVTAMWIWLCNELLDEPANRTKLFDFCAKYEVDELFFQIIADAIQQEDGTWACEVSKKDELRSFIADCTAHNVRVHALDGYPDWAMKPWHGKVIAQVQALIDYNASVKPEERFYGLHYDIEPYLMIGFNDLAYKKKVLLEYCELNEICARMVREQSDMVYGVDIPFWYEEGGDECVIEFGGKTQAASYHIIDICDNVGIMDYRDFTDGADGIARHGLDEVRYADKVGKKIYIGVETFKYAPTTCVAMLGLPEEDFLKRLNDGTDMISISRLNGFRIQVMKLGGYVHLALEKPPELSEEREKVFNESLIQLAKVFGVDNTNESLVEDTYYEAEFGCAQQVTLEGFDRVKIVSEDGKETWPAFSTVSQMYNKITFAEESYAHFKTEIEQVKKAFASHPSFYGIAIHYYKTYIELIKKGDSDE